eukprot:NODE_10153_length_607_cov_79.735537_g9879_i0.p2 GENE.NODE_10153_length_607_cov_79.735537_g9879_i0~~NODE_10153_length_607_cov_79.735537_g9879_i0.p2  ORF type:complete len:112 (+),score=38.42 NODE_10153_length_607_cov_79.735537_g9879_i0:71-406(+)
MQKLATAFARPFAQAARLQGRRSYTKGKDKHADHDQEDLEWMETDKTMSQEEHYARRRQKEILAKMAAQAAELEANAKSTRLETGKAEKSPVDKQIEALSAQLESLKASLK